MSATLDLSAAAPVGMIADARGRGISPRCPVGRLSVDHALGLRQIRPHYHLLGSVHAPSWAMASAKGSGWVTPETHRLVWVVGIPSDGRMADAPHIEAVAL